jgi:DNA-binding transcriptional LysR family regulator
MTFDQLEVLKAIVEHGSFRKASETLNRAQSAISYAVRNLEDELGFLIFDRSRYRSQMTPQGEAFFRKSQGVFQSLRELESYAKSLRQGCEPQVRLAVAALIPLKEIIKNLDQLKWRFPQTELKLVVEILGGDQLLMQDQVDLAITDIRAQNSQIESISLGYISLLAVVAKGHPLAKTLTKKKLELGPQELKTLPQIVLRSSPSAPNRSAGILNVSNLWSVSEFTSKKELLLAGLGWGYMPQHLILNELVTGRLVQILTDPYKVEIFLSWNKQKEMGPSTRFLWDACKTLKIQEF